MKHSSPDWDAVRSEFPAIGSTVYLNTAGGAPLSRAVAAAGARFYEQMRDVGDRMWPKWLAEVEVTRIKAARLINAPQECISFAPNTSHAMNIAANYLKNTGVKSVLSMADSFPAITVPLSHQGFDVELIESMTYGSVPVQSVRDAVSTHTGALFISSVEYGTGYAYDLKAMRKLCDEYSLSYVVDASQSMGAFPFDVSDIGVDFAAASTYKWLMCGYGLSVFYIAAKWLEAEPPLAGWMSVADDNKLNSGPPYLKNTAAVNELGCPNFPAVFALGAAIDFITELGGPVVIGQRVRELADYLIGALRAAGFTIASSLEDDKISGIVLIDMPDAPKIAARLKEHDVFVSAKGLGLRVSVYIYNSFNDIDRFVHALTKVAKPGND